MDKSIVVAEGNPATSSKRGLSLFPLAWTYAVLSAAAVSLVSVLAP